MKYFFKFIFFTSLVIFNYSALAQTTITNPQACTQIVSADLCQKIGQLLIVGFGGFKQDENGKVIWDDSNGLNFNENSRIAHDIADWKIGGVFLSRMIYRDKKTGKYLRQRNLDGAHQIIHLTEALQAYNQKIRQQQNLPDTPLFITIDQEGGMVNSLNFPSMAKVAQALGKNEEISFNDPKKRQEALDFTYQYALHTANELRELGINLNFAPDVDVDINPVNPIIGSLGRSFSDNPQIVTDQANETIKGFHEGQIIPALKHFPGHGSSTGDTHKELVDVTNTYQREKELMPYKILISQGYDDVIMSTHVINGQIDRSQCRSGDPNDAHTWCPGTMSYKTLTELLRNQLNFKGIIVSDDMSMAAIAANYPLDIALEKALNAGVNMFIVSNHDDDYTGKFVITIAQLVKSGKINPDRIEQAYQRIIAAKQKLPRFSGSQNGKEKISQTLQQESKPKEPDEIPPYPSSKLP